MTTTAASSGLDLTLVRAVVDAWWDDDRGLLRSPAGRHDGVEHPAGAFHLVPATAWYAYGLLASGDDSDLRRATAALEALVDLQYDLPGAPWNGTWPIHAESPAPGPGRSRLGRDWDPDRRQVVGSTLALILADHADRLPAGVRGRAVTAVARAVATEPPERIDPEYTNVALLHAWLAGHVGALTGDREVATRGHALAAAIAARHARIGGFDEFPSPTYDGIALWALGLWTALPPEPAFLSAGRGMRAELLRDLAARYHPRLGNIAGPYARAHELDATRAVAAGSLWLADLLARDGAPLPPLEVGGRLDQGQDLPLAFLVPRLREPVSEAVRHMLTSVGGTVRPSRLPGRRLSAWVGDGLALGAETTAGPLSDRPQAVAALAHWPGREGTAWLALRPTTKLDGTVRPRHLVLRTFEPDGLPAELDPAGAPIRVQGRSILSGDLRLDVDADLDADLDEATGRWRLRFDVAPGATIRLVWTR